MGSLYTYKCDSCDYTVVSSGKLDYGFMGVLKPYICTDCNEVCDVLVGDMGGVIPEDLLNDIPLVNPKEDFYSCPECNGKNLTVWNPHHRKCPKCNGRMKLDKSAGIMMWD